MHKVSMTNVFTIESCSVLMLENVTIVALLNSPPTVEYLRPTYTYSIICKLLKELTDRDYNIVPDSSQIYFHRRQFY